ncbi:DUF5518 domain-containing protein [Methanobacterium spitsbergense]|jgi:hypothetical protein|uniref:DUF5518 domain-containing protein n=1 Tax=Methanobacterium spitsbergense TaxID=2874285 RepID=A0A8T5UNC6_9EURY|nr:DUF5518 domain-containing protein [Methanobacterium spitsbergense]MBZ2165154.1 DUF5518 domain-containing protein [Methanobacterium spitsbergense]
MVNWGAVIIGFFLSIILGGIFAIIIPIWGGLLGLLLAGMAVGYIVGGDAMNGAVNGALAGVFGAIVLSFLLLIAGTLILGIIGFAAATITSLFILVGFIGVMIVMAVGGAIGSVVKNEPEVRVVEYRGP